MAKAQHKRAGDVFDNDLARDLENAEFARIYALKLAKINAIADILDAIEAAREEKHISKAEIGRRIDRKPSAVSRLLNGTEQNPTWDTLVDLAYAVDLELEVKVKKAPRRRAAPAPVKVLRAA
ncbi:MAG TPA: helix-turn-helix transcriptional regulator [Gaiellaceae bacterium]|nr:helix-turn-helix transcriptional regulator [Gaiellaceae bacterium]